MSSDIRLEDIDRAEVLPVGKYLRVDLDGVDTAQIIEQIGIGEILSEIGANVIVDEMGDYELLSFIDEDSIRAYIQD